MPGRNSNARYILITFYTVERTGCSPQGCRFSASVLLLLVSQVHAVTGADMYGCDLEPLFLQ